MNRFLRRLQRAGIGLPAALTAGLWLKGLHPWLPGFPCPFRHLTGVPCPTCFLTRATSAALVGDWPLAVRLHAFGPVVAIALVGWSFLAIRQRRLVPRPLPAWPLTRGVVALLAYWVVRLVVSHGPGRGAFLSFPVD
jgi:hypothetical protein